MSILVKAVQEVYYAIKTGKIKDVTMEFGLNKAVMQKIKYLYDKTITTTPGLSHYRIRTIRSIQSAVKRVVSSTGKRTNKLAHSALAPIAAEFAAAETAQQKNGIYIYLFYIIII